MIDILLTLILLLIAVVTAKAIKIDMDDYYCIYTGKPPKKSNPLPPPK